MLCSNEKALAELNYTRAVILPGEVSVRENFRC